MSSKNESVTIEDLIKAIKSYFPDADTELVVKAYQYAKKCHEGQTRLTGEPYIQHPLHVTLILCEMRMDLSSICAGLLHDVVEDCKITLEEISQNFSPTIASLVDGVTKIGKIPYKSKAEQQSENFRKMLIYMGSDIRVILIKLADRLHNMRTLSSMKPHKQVEIASETMEIYAPISNRLGMNKLKSELEDLSFRYLKPEIYYKIKEEISQTKEDRQSYTNNVIKDIQAKLSEYGIKADVTGRPKHFYSIYKKMEKDALEAKDIHDLIAFRILVENIPECYKALGVIHSVYIPIPGRFKDYIAVPKENSYQSLHTTVIGPQNHRIEVQIRTQEMHLVAEQGIAAHWKYKEGVIDQKDQKQLQWVNRLLEWQKEFDDPAEFIDSVKSEIFDESIFVFTPAGEVKELSMGSSALDFAYSVHTDVGHHCIGAKVNGKLVPIKHKLKNGDNVEILTSPNQSPSRDWLKFVKSTKARAKIRAFIKTQQRDKAKKTGEELLDKFFRDCSVDKKKGVQLLKPLIDEMHFQNIDDLYISIGYGKFDVAKIPEKVSAFKPKEQETAKPNFIKKIFEGSKKRPEGKNLIYVDGLDDVLIRYAKCCNPLPGDPIVGFITLGKGITVHEERCPRVLEKDPSRRVRVAWNKTSTIRRPVKIRIVCKDTPGMLNSITQVLSSQGINISGIDIRSLAESRAVCLLDIGVESLEQLNQTMSLIERQKGVFSVDRYHG